MRFEWQGALKDLYSQYTSVKLQHQISDMRTGFDGIAYWYEHFEKAGKQKTAPIILESRFVFFCSLDTIQLVLFSECAICRNFWYPLSIYFSLIGIWTE